MTRKDFEDKYEKGNINIVEKIANLDNDPKFLMFLKFWD